MDYSSSVEAYRKHKNLHIAAEELGIKWQTLYTHLVSAGEPVCGDKSKYGSDKDKLAAKAERMFSELLPFAENMNSQQWQSKIDFVVNGRSVDIKAARLCSANGKYKSTRWAFSLKKQESIADFFVLYAFDSEGEKLEGIYLIIGDLVRYMTTINIPRTNGKWSKYKITEQDLLEFFKGEW